MRVPINRRLQCCASLVPPGARVYDVGCDHGYLGIYLLTQGLAAHVTASDLRPKPLDRARENARRFGVAAGMDFVCCDGLQAMDGSQGDTLVIAGMGGDAIAGILADCAWVKDSRYTLILQPQSSGNDLRRYLGQHGFSILEEQLVQDGGFVYSVMVCRYGGGQPLSPGQQYLSPQLLARGGELLEIYFDHVTNGLERAVVGLQRSKNPKDVGRLPYYQTALDEIREMREQYDNRTSGA